MVIKAKKKKQGKPRETRNISFSATFFLIPFKMALPNLMEQAQLRILSASIDVHFKTYGWIAHAGSGLYQNYLIGRFR